ncbi:NADH-quinone oxidoreductase subunit L [Shewanella surugensis]|uniref:NADH-quinone oxidoreductase subunit L n=1 Tax=Shewanella surugensis TaxID=212020 RepID=A0ABT0LA99_9GAMM|nr:NADH-quinone oxidoreductase subunit L [Shewanella surugensis]MCL1124086.1 NADH-quinone oxidoreductase subunit L [Shewanella surugensis]
MNSLIWLIPGAPLIGAGFIILFGSLISAQICARMAALMVLISATLVLSLWVELLGQANTTVPNAILYHQALFSWMSIGDWKVDLSLTVDKISLIMMTVASSVGFLIHLFSINFMKDEQGERRYFFYLNLFIFGMLSFVMAHDLILLYLGWEVMGLCSYALVAFYYQKSHYAYCGRKAFVVTRIGDTALAIAIMVIFANFHSIELPQIATLIDAQQINPISLTLIGGLLIIAAIAKSAQFPLHVWLPDAMTGPSTVSALIHAATMVTAGVYLLIRFHPLFDQLPDLQLIIAFIGCLTAFFAASAALSQNDLKKILAYSTISQIGYMFAAVGVGAYGFALFHLIVHACFKALLFMSSGVIIKAYNEEHDIRKMGGLGQKMPFLRYIYLIGSLTLAALPFVTASYYSKDPIIAATYTQDFGFYLTALALLGALMTGLYSMRMYLMIFSGTPRSEIHPYAMSIGMKLPLTILAFLSITIGFIQTPWSWGPELLIPWLASDLGLPHLPHGAIDVTINLLGIAASLIGIGLACYLTPKELKHQQGLGNVAFLNQAWYIDALSMKWIVTPYYYLCSLCRVFIEKVVFFHVIESSITGMLITGHRSLSRSQAGLITRYLYFICFGAIGLLAYILMTIYPIHA